MSDASLPADWELCQLASKCRIVSGSTPKTAVEEYWGGDISWITPNDLSKNRSKFVSAGERFLTAAGYDSCSTQLLPPGSVLFTSRAPIGYVAIASQEVCTNQGFKTAIPSESLSSEFLYWQLQHLVDDIRSRASGTTFLEISGKGFGATQIVVPRLAEQERIVEILEEQLSRLDAAVKSVQTVREKADQFRRSLLLRLLTPSPENSECGGNGGWRTERLGSVVSFLNGYAFKSEWYEDKGVRLVRGENISHGYLDWSEPRRVSERRAEEFARFALSEGDILVSLDRPIISTGFKWAVVRKSDLPALLLQRVAVIRPNEEVLDSGFLRLWVQSPFLVEKINPGRSNGIPHISTRELAELEISFPSLEIQREIALFVEKQLETNARNCLSSASILKLALKMRRSLLHAAFTGELTRSWREAHV